MKIDKVLETLNEALSAKELTIWLQQEEIKALKKELEKLKGENNEQSN